MNEKRGRITSERRVGDGLEQKVKKKERTKEKKPEGFKKVG